MNEDKPRQNSRGAAPAPPPPHSQATQVAAEGMPSDLASARNTQELLQLLARMLTEPRVPPLGREAIAAIARYSAIRDALAHDQREAGHVQISR